MSATRSDYYRALYHGQEPTKAERRANRDYVRNSPSYQTLKRNNKARSAAQRRLAERHPKEFKRLYEEELGAS